MKLLYDYALTFCNIPYKWGGNDPMEGLDCSNLIRIILKAEGFNLNGMNSQAMYNYFRNYNEGTNIDLGALIFYGKSEKEIVHIALALDKHRHIEAASGNSSVSDLETAIEKNAFVRITPIRKDYFMAIMPNYPFKVVQYP